jgi:hypothetical protein
MSPLMPSNLREVSHPSLALRVTRTQQTVSSVEVCTIMPGTLPWCPWLNHTHGPRLEAKGPPSIKTAWGQKEKKLFGGEGLLGGEKP